MNEQYDHELLQINLSQKYDLILLLSAQIISMQMSSTFFSDHRKEINFFSFRQPKVLPQFQYEINFPSILSLYLLANVTLFSPIPTFVPFFLVLSVFHPSFSLFLSLPFPLSLPSLLLPSTVFFISPRLLHGRVSNLLPLP